MKAHLFSSFIVSCLLLAGNPALAQSILLVKPIGFEIGKTNLLVIRGVGLTNSALELSASNGSLVILTNQKAEVNNQMDAKKVGDTEIHAQLFATSTNVALLLGTNAPFNLVAITNPLKETEPNNGFLKPQKIQRKTSIQGEIGKPNDVDVYHFELRKWEKLSFKITAELVGSPLDSTITVYNSGGHMLATNDDKVGSRDSALEFTAPESGTYFLSIIDALEKGSPVHIYLIEAVNQQK